MGTAISPPSWRQRAEDNIAAILTAREIERQDRPARPHEQEKLIRLRKDRGRGDDVLAALDECTVKRFVGCCPSGLLRSEPDPVLVKGRVPRRFAAVSTLASQGAAASNADRGRGPHSPQPHLFRLASS
jgi:hypothetical protein